MKIAIYGDSFAVDSSKNPRKLGWVDHLSKKYNITNYAKQGSSLYYSYKEFLRTQAYYDKIIFLVTNFGRLYVPNADQPHIPGLYNAKKYLRESIYDKEKYQAAIDFFLHLQNDNYESDIHRLILKEITNLRPNELYVPCFGQSLISDWKFCTMMDIQLIDFQFYKIDPTAFGESAIELRNCHMNDENNFIFYNKILEWIESGNFKMAIEDFSTPTKPLEYYFINP